LNPRPVLKRRKPANGGASAILYQVKTTCQTHTEKNLPVINVVKNDFCTPLAMNVDKVLLHPRNQMIFKNALYDLM
jgi:hypothetical protein